MAKIYDDIEIALTLDELRQALRAWMGSKTSIYEYRVTTVRLHPTAKYVVRFTVEPPLSPTEKKAVTQDAELKQDL